MANDRIVKDCENIAKAQADARWRILAPVLVICAGVCWGIIGLFSTALADMGLSSIQITVVRCVIAAACFGAWLLIFDRGAFRFRLQDIWMFLGTGVASIAFFNVCYFACIKECNLSIACILLYTAPCFVTLLSRFLFQEFLTLRKVIALVGAFCGCVFVVGIGTGDSALSLAGVLMGLGSGIGYALYSIFGRFALGRYGTMTITFYTFLFAALALLPFCQPEGIVNLALYGCVDPSFASGSAGAAVATTAANAANAEAVSVTAAATTAATANSGFIPVSSGVAATATGLAAVPFFAQNPLAIMLLLGVVSTVTPFACYTNGLAHMETSKASIMAFVEPLVALVIGAAVFHDALTLLNYLGIALIAGSILLLNLPSKRQ